MGGKWQRDSATGFTTQTLRSLQESWSVSSDGYLDKTAFPPGVVFDAKRLAKEATYSHSYFVDMVVHDRTGYWDFVGRQQLTTIGANDRQFWAVWANPQSVAVAGARYRDLQREEARKRGQQPQLVTAVGSANLETQKP